MLGCVQGSAAGVFPEGGESKEGEEVPHCLPGVGPGLSGARHIAGRTGLRTRVPLTTVASWSV